MYARGGSSPPTRTSDEGSETLKYQWFGAFRFPENHRMVTPVVTKIPGTQKSVACEPRLPRAFTPKTIAVIGNGRNQTGVSRNDAPQFSMKMCRVPALSAVLRLLQRGRSFYDSEY